MAIWTTTLDDNVDSPYIIEAVANGESFRCTFTWDATYDEILADLEKEIQNRRNAKPLSTADGTMLRDYDYFAYYTTIPLDVQSFIDTADYLPYDIRKMPDYLQANALWEERMFAVEAYNIWALYKEQVCWSVRAERGTEVVVASVRKGGWNYFDDNVGFRFVSDKIGDIGRNDLGYVTMEVDDGVN